MDTLKINKAKNKTTTNINAKKDDFFSENASFFPESSKIWEQHILKSLEKKEALDQFLTRWYQKKIVFLCSAGKNFHIWLQNFFLNHNNVFLTISIVAHKLSTVLIGLSKNEKTNKFVGHWSGEGLCCKVSPIWGATVNSAVNK